MAFMPLGIPLLRRVMQSGSKQAKYSILLQKSMTYKSAISLDTLYPNSSLKLATPAFTPNPDEKFTGHIPLNKVDIHYSASSGPGGQNVNKVHTKVDLRFKLDEADWIPTDIKQKMLEIHGKKLTKEGYLIIRSDTTRSQQLNLADCLRKLRVMIRNATFTESKPDPETEERIRQRHLKSARLRVSMKREEAYKRALKRPPTVVDL
ncbi:unnamed protein product [Leptosia nina]|uniref:Large ribosomal subunit protein mL62 n=1 Tax=Leptosia nina TaxID=320188 RepID=A0AAV1JBN1_9NEOP